MEFSLTPLQKEALGRLYGTWSDFHITFIVGREESYLKIILGDSVEIWLYSDELEFKTGSLNQHYESIDFENQGLQLNQFIKDIREYAPARNV